MNPQQAEQPEQKVNVFDENGNTVEETMLQEDQPESYEAAQSDNTQEELVPEQPKYRIGDKWFSTQEEALTYAQSQVSALETETQVADAYRQGMRDALTHTPATESVTPAPAVEDDLDTDKLYTNPKEFLREYGQRIKTEAQSAIEQRESVRQQSDQIWREFTERHPSLADFRAEAEQFVDQNLTTVRAIIGTKGRPASYDFIATKLKSRFESYANAVKPKRELPNTGAGTTPGMRAASVTPKIGAKKPSTLAEQLRSIRRKGR
jgi:hypothetical protein